MLTRTGAGHPESRFRALPCDFELERQLRISDSEIPRQHFLFTLLHIFIISFPPVFLTVTPEPFQIFRRTIAARAQSQVSTDPFASFGTE
jgi:hypothetical protein